MTQSPTGAASPFGDTAPNENTANLGKLNKPSIFPRETNDFLNGFSGNANAAYFGLGGGIVSSPGNGNAILLGVRGGYSLGPPNKIGGGGGFGSGLSYNQGYTGFKW